MRWSPCWRMCGWGVDARITHLRLLNEKQTWRSSAALPSVGEGTSKSMLRASVRPRILAPGTLKDVGKVWDPDGTAPALKLLRLGSGSSQARCRCVRCGWRSADLLRPLQMPNNHSLPLSSRNTVCRCRRS